jgi:glucan phosphoethanolaminetransferase (alkaline phosphatase superfamily)
MKKTVLWILLDSIFVILFNTFFFVIGGADHNASVWISYGFIHFSYLMVLLTPYLVRKGKSATILSLSIYSISIFYFSVVRVTGIIFILIAPESHIAALLIQLCIAGIYGGILISNLIANEHTADTEVKRQYEIAYVKDASIRLKGLLHSVSDIEAKKGIERVYDAVYSSPAKSHPDIAQMESQILQTIYELENAVSTQNIDAIVSLAHSLLAAVNERNMRLKTLN